jgi:hypothetical protein
VSDIASPNEGMISDRSPWDPKTEALLEDWHARAMAARASHYALASRLRVRNLLIGVPSVLFSSVVGTSLFATLTQEDVNKTLRIVIGTVSFLAAALAALQTFFRFHERAERHVLAADWYSAIRRDLAEVIALPSDQREQPKECLDRLRKEMNKVGQQAPEIDEHVWAKMAKAHGVKDAQ